METDFNWIRYLGIGLLWCFIGMFALAIIILLITIKNNKLKTKFDYYSNEILAYVMVAFFPVIIIGSLIGGINQAWIWILLGIAICISAVECFELYKNKNIEANNANFSRHAKIIFSTFGILWIILIGTLRFIYTAITNKKI
jgi:hypothetical protein